MLAAHAIHMNRRGVSALALLTSGEAPPCAPPGLRAPGAGGAAGARWRARACAQARGACASRGSGKAGREEGGGEAAGVRVRPPPLGARSRSSTTGSVPPPGALTRAPGGCAWQGRGAGVQPAGPRCGRVATSVTTPSYPGPGLSARARPRPPAPSARARASKGFLYAHGFYELHPSGPGGVGAVRRTGCSSDLGLRERTARSRSGRDGLRGRHARQSGQERARRRDGGRELLRLRGLGLLGSHTVLRGRAPDRRVHARSPESLSGSGSGRVRIRRGKR
jgi:hypothetical protein